MRFKPPSISQKGLEKHLDDLGVSYTRVYGYFKNGATDTFVAKNTGHNRHTVGKWRKVYNDEEKYRQHEAAIDSLNNV
jgi:hypothetical protein